MSDNKKLNDEIRNSILDFLNQQLENPTADTTPLSVTITEACVNNKTEEAGRSGILAENEKGPHFIKGHEPLFGQQYRILSIDDNWTDAEWWNTCPNLPDSLDVALALAAEYMHGKGEDAPLVFDNRKLAILHYLPRLKNDPDKDFCSRVADLLQSLDRQ